MAAMDQVMIRLHHALEGGALPPEGRKLGQRLMTQLHQPTRIAVIGLGSAGKTSLINMLLGAYLMPDLAGIAAVEVSHGDAARSQITLADGTIAMGEGLLDPKRIPAAALRVALQLPDPALKDWSFTEIALSPAASAQASLLDWMAGRSDIVIWCTQQFDARERALWSQAPEHLKDHSFLALTRADRLYMKGELASRIAALQPVVADEFLSLFPIATLQAAAARGAEHNDALWRSSGGKAFFDGIRQQVDQARTADLDHAFMLLERYKVSLPEPPASRPQPAELPAAIVTPLPAPGRKADADADDVITSALNVLRGCAGELMAIPEAASGAVTDRILERCSQTAEDLVQLLSQSDDPSPALAAIREDVADGEQMLMLLRLERGETAAEDSLTVLLQLKKELSERVAL